jgi:predicted RNA-binding Zn-ribbon protein involved in translation (DUF1610 family)
MKTEGDPVEIKGKQLVCAHCGGKRFARREAQLNTAVMTFFDMDWLNKSAEVFACVLCGRLEWFLDPTLSPKDDAADATECVACGETIPEGKDTCPKCGWTYKE